MTWRDGVFVPERSGSSLDALAREQEINEIFLKIMARLLHQGKDLSPGTAHNYAPTILAGQQEAKDAKIRSVIWLTFDRLLNAK